MSELQQAYAQALQQAYAQGTNQYPAYPMANRDGREALREAEGEMLDALAEALTSDQWVNLLRTSLEAAAAKGNRGLAQKLVGAGAEIGDALHKAVRGGHVGVVKDLLESGASVDAKNERDWTPLHYAAGDGNTEMVQLLLLEGADQDADCSNQQPGSTPLALAATMGHVATALALIAAGADVSFLLGPSKISILHLAAGIGYVDLLRAAIEHGADLECAYVPLEYTALHWAVKSAEEGSTEVVNALAEVGANVEARDRDGRTPLHHAALRPNVEAVVALLKHGADVNAQINRQETQETPLHFAARKAGTQGIAEVVDLLLRSGADETILANEEGIIAADVVGDDIEEEDSLAEDVERVHQLLANAPADRAWRRRGYLVLCRAHADRVQLTREISRTPAGMARRTRSGRKLARTEEANGCAVAARGSAVEEQPHGDGLVAEVLGLQEGLFRTIVGYL